MRALGRRAIPAPGRSVRRRWRRPGGAARTTRQVFRDDTSEQEFRRDGFAVVPFLTPTDADALATAFQEDWRPTSVDAYHHDLWGLDRDRKEAVAAVLDPVVQPALDAVLQDYRPRTKAFIRKQPGEETAVPPHVDISFVDERRWRSVMVWCSLTGHERGDGLVHVVPGSQHLRPGVRAHRDDASTFPDLMDEIVREWGVAVPLPIGSAIIFDHATVHYAEPNLGTKDRLTLQCVCTPQEAQLLYPLPSSPGRAVVLAVDDAFYRGFSLNDRPNGELLGRYDAVAEVAIPTQRLTAADLAKTRGDRSGVRLGAQARRAHPEESTEKR